MVSHPPTVRGYPVLGSNVGLDPLRHLRRPSVTVRQQFTCQPARPEQAVG